MPRIIAAIFLAMFMATSAHASAPQPPQVPGTRVACVDREQETICHIFGSGQGADRTTELRQATKGTEWQYVRGCLIGFSRYRRNHETCLGYWTNQQARPEMTETDRLKARVLELQATLSNEMSMAQTQHDIDHCSEVASHAPDAEHRDVFFTTCLKVQRESRRMSLVEKGILPQVQ